MNRGKENKLERQAGLVGNWYYFAFAPGSIIKFEKRTRELDISKGKESSFGMAIFDYGRAGFLEAVRLAGYGYVAYKIYESLK